MRLSRINTKGIALSLATTILYIIIFISGIFTFISSFFLDLMYQHEGYTSPDIKIVAIDDKSIEELGRFDSWSRDIYTTLIEKLNKDGNKPSVIAFDIIFSGLTNSEADDNLAKEVAKHNNIICGVNLSFSKKDKDNSIKNEVILNPLYPALNEVSNNAYVNTALDKEDSYIRRVIPKIYDNDHEYISLSYKAYLMHMNNLGIEPNRYDSNKYYHFKYSAKPNRGYTVISLADILNDRIPLNDFKDNIVLVGAYANALGDAFYQPIDRGRLMFGVEIHANLIDAYINDYLYSDINYYLNLFISSIIILVISLFLYKAKIIKSSIASGLGIITLLGLQSILFINRLYMPLIIPSLYVIILYIGNILYSYFSERRLKLITIDAFKKYVAPEVVDKAIKDGKLNMELKGEKRRLCCLFVDIRGFTSLSEEMEPGDVVDILNSYLSIVTKAIMDNGGTLDKFIGDAAMALFNAPFDLDDYMYKACKCAVEIRNESERLNEYCLNKYKRSVGFGIGINIGDAVVGNIGSSARMDFTAIGDTINTASRLEGKAEREEILISEDLYNEIKERVRCEYVGNLSLKGKSNGINTYKIIDLGE